MKIETMMRYGIIFFIGLCFACTNTNERAGDQTFKESVKVIQPENPFAIKTNRKTNQFKVNEPIELDIVLKDTTLSLDSVQVYLNGGLLQTRLQPQFTITINSGHLGKSKLACRVFFKDTSYQESISVTFFSDIVPKSIRYSLVKTYPHSTENFTQGLVYEDGFLYEGTGEFGFSALLKTKLETAEVVQSLSLASDKFGEGIALFNNKVVQITYKSMVGYVYDKSTFEKKHQFSYPYSKEGWGLTVSKGELLMSNGTNKIISIDTTNYSFLKETQVYDNNSAVDNLNELEYTEGVIYANIWMKNKIVQIDHETGKVLGYLDLTNLVPEKYKSHHAHVLNGIAIIPESGHLLITGKRWDVIYEIKVH